MKDKLYPADLLDEYMEKSPTDTFEVWQAKRYVNDRLTLFAIGAVTFAVVVTAGLLIF